MMIIIKIKMQKILMTNYIFYAGVTQMPLNPAIFIQ